jgi:predicted kinase
MPTLHLICGLPGSGKTTLALRLEQELPALRLTPDEWMARIVGDGHNEAARAAVEAVQEDLAHRAMDLGLDVILENGFWSKEERNAYRQRAASNGNAVKVHFLDVPLEELWRRVEERNASMPPDTFHITRQQLESWWNVFERPTAAELT